MHPIERLRHVARADGARPSLLVQEAASALASFGSDPAGMVTACRRLVDRHPAVGPMWWLAARVLCSGDPVAEAFKAAGEIDADPTPRTVAARLPLEGAVAVVGWPELAGAALRHAAPEVFVIDAGGRWTGVTDRLQRLGVEAVDVPESGLAAAVVEADMLVLEASALGPAGWVGETGSRAAAAVARHAGVPIVLVAGVGRVLPGRLWEAMARRLDDGDEPWLADDEVVPLDLVDEIIGPAASQSPGDAVRRADCPVAPELLKVTG
jgi:hypothetical protein